MAMLFTAKEGHENEVLNRLTAYPGLEQAMYQIRQALPPAIEAKACRVEAVNIPDEPPYLLVSVPVGTAAQVIVDLNQVALVFTATPRLAGKLKVGFANG